MRRTGLNRIPGSTAGIAFLAFAAFAAPDDPAPPGALVDAGGYRVHLYCTGGGSPTVVVAGAGFSFDWGLVQPKISTLTRICTYDPSGTAWSDPPAEQMPACAGRVAELHEVLHRAAVSTPVILVGYSIGGLYARLYAARYPEDVAGMVIVDHAFIEAPHSPPPAAESHAPPKDGVYSVEDIDTPPALISQTPIALGIEDDRNFQRLPKLNRDLHAWAMSRNPLRPTPENAAECAAEVDKETRGQTNPLGARPLVVISTNYDSPGYRQLQAQLLGLSRNAKQIMAERSTHMVIVDQPETIVAAIEDVLQSIRSRTPLK